MMRGLGYHFQRVSAETDELEFARPRRGYPRLHLFVKTKDNELFLSLHLDQKKPVYKGATAHSGDYGGRVVKTEMARIEKFLKSNA